jgi:RNA polymerase sigma factor (sigma-70 family)
MDWRRLDSWDAQIAALLAADAFDVLARVYEGVIIGYCTNLLGDHARGEDAAQVIFVAAYQAMPRFQGHATIRTGLFAIARRHCLKRLRDDRRRADIERARGAHIAAAVHSSPPISPEDAAIEKEEIDQAGARRCLLRQGLSRLSKRDQELIVKHYFEQQSVKDMAHGRWISEATVRRRLEAATKRLRQVIDHDTTRRGV